MLSLDTLGSVDLRTRDGRSVQSVLAQPKRFALLVFLAVEGTYQQRDRLLAMFWSETDEASGRHALSQALHRLRAGLGHDLIATRGHNEVALAEEGLKCDAVVFARLIRQQRWGDALDLYRGSFLQGFHTAGADGFDRWADAERDRFRREAGRAAWALTEEQLLRNAAPEALRTSLRACELCPTDEDCARRAMTRLAKLGYPTAALELFGVLRKRLQSDFDLSVASETEAVAAWVRAQATGGEQRGGVLVDAAQSEVESPPAEQQSPEDGPRLSPAALNARHSALRKLAVLTVVVLTGGIAFLLPQWRDEMNIGWLRITDGTAYEWWLRGNMHAARRRSGDIEKCTEYARESIRADSTFAPGYQLLATCYNLMAFVTPIDPFPLFGGAKAAAQRALELDPDLPEAHSALAYAIAHHDWDWSQAEQIYRRAIALNPGDANIHQDFAWLLSWNGRFPEALAHARLAQRLNPLAPQTILRLSMILHLARRHPEARVEALRALELDSTFMFAYDRLHWALHGMGEHEEAVEAAERAAAVAGPRDVRRRAFLAHAYGVAGRRAEAETILAELLDREERSYVPPTAIAAAYVGIGESNQALDWLERGFVKRDGGMVLLATFSLWDPLRESPRFQELVRRMRFSSSERNSTT